MCVVFKILHTRDAIIFADNAFEAAAAATAALAREKKSFSFYNI